MPNLAYFIIIHIMADNFVIKHTYLCHIMISTFHNVDWTNEPPQNWVEDEYNKVAEDQYWNWKDEKFQYSPTRTAKNPGYVGGYACDNLAMSLHCIYHTDSYETAVLRCINRWN